MEMYLSDRFFPPLSLSHTLTQELDIYTHTAYTFRFQIYTYDQFLSLSNSPSPPSLKHTAPLKSLPTKHGLFCSEIF